MEQIDKLKEYCKNQLLDCEFKNDILYLSDSSQELKIIDNDQLLLDEEMKFVPSVGDKGDYQGWVFELAGRWYYLLREEEFCTLNELRYIGKAVQKLPTKNFLGIRSGYEMMNGTGMYPEYIKKAKFLGIENFGICEKHTLSGVMDFQQQCLHNELKPIIGMTISVSIDEVLYDFKAYAKNFQGWQSLLKFNAEINVEKNISISVDLLENNAENIFIIADPKSLPYENIISCIDYYQLDTVEFSDFDLNNKYLNNLEKYLQDRNLKPIAIMDSFCLEKEYQETRELLWQINKSYDIKTKNQYFKNNDQYAIELKNLVEDGNDSWKKLYKMATKNLQYVVDNCNFIYDMDTRHLPKYIMTDEDKKLYKDNKDMFIHLVKEGLKFRKIKDINKYLDRLKTEIKVLKMGDVIDYFLSLYDIIKFAHSKGLLTGIGRGCFKADSKVRMKDGTFKNIEDVKIGDEVFNFFNKYATVKETHVYDVEEELVTLHFDKTDITCTKDHKFLTKNRGWIDADELTEEDLIESNTTYTQLLNKTYSKHKGKVYDIGVDTDDHSYTVNNVVVHNSAGGSLVAYLMGLIQVDPLEFDLLFERFLNSGRMGEWEDKPMYSFEMEDGSKIDLIEGTLVKVKRKGKEITILSDEIEENDDILKY